jgi:DNA repair ATPase RecN
VEVMKTKTAKLHDERRIEAAERAADEFGSFNAFVRLALDEYDEESRLEREVEELAEELESKRDRLAEVRESNEETEQESDEPEVPEGLGELYSVDGGGDDE